LATQPHQLRDEFSLPDDTSEQANWDWLIASTREFIQPVTDAFHQDKLRQSFDNYRMRLSGLDVSGILVWYSGKDLLAFIARGIGAESPGKIRKRLRDWVRNNPDAALNLLPEWAALKKILNR
jgi:hypothetical protein